jgi:hypothetical protein
MKDFFIKAIKAFKNLKMWFKTNIAYIIGILAIAATILTGIFGPLITEKIKGETITSKKEPSLQPVSAPLGEPSEPQG